MQENSYQIDDNIPNTNYFTYQGKNYPIKFDYFKYSSRYFANNRLELKSKKFIQLVDDEIQKENILSEDGIKSFIKYAQHQPIRFLFKCLDKYGKEASILFSIADFGNEGKKYLSLLTRDYSKIFDFHFIDEKIIDSIYKEENEILSRKISEEEIIKKQEEKIQSLEQTITELKNELNEMKNDQIQSNLKMTNEIQSNQQRQEKTLSQVQEQMKLMQDEISNIKKSHENELLEQKNHSDNEIDQLKMTVIPFCCPI